MAVYAAPRPMGLTGRTLGLFGLGKIGKAVSRRAQGFGMRVLAVDPRATPEQAEAVGACLSDEATALARGGRDQQPHEPDWGE